MMPTKYCSLHQHSDASFLDSCNKPAELAQKAKEVGMSAIALTDHGNVHNYIKMYKECKKQGIKFIPGCCLPGQIIFTKNGPLNIEEIKIGDEVLTHKGRFKKVINTSQRIYSGILYGIECWNNNKIWLTDEHPVLIHNKNNENEWIRADQIMHKHYKKIINGHMWESYVCINNNYEFEKLNQINIKDYISNENYNYRSYHLPEKIKLDFDFGRFCGLWLSEGSFGKNIKVVNFTLNIKENNLLNFIKDFCNKFNIKINYRNRNFPEKNGKIRNTIDIEIYCQELAQLLYKLFGKGAKTKLINKDILYINNNEFHQGIINGIMLGDAKNALGQYTLKLANKKLIYQIKHLLSKFNISVKISKLNNLEHYYFTYTQNRDKRIYTKNDNQYIYCPIKKIDKKEYNGTVYNITVEEDNSYVSDFILHNCEFYFTHKHEERERKSRHITILAMNDEGLKTIYELSTASNVPVDQGGGFFYRPRIDWAMLEKLNKGLICLTGCMNSPVNHEFGRNKDYNTGKIHAERLVKIFGKERLFIELQLVNDPLHWTNDRKIYIPEQDIIIEYSKKLATDLGLKTVATNDCLVPGTFISTNNGFCKIEELKIGDNVWTHTGELKRVVYINNREESKEVYSIKPFLGSFPIKCSDNHPFFVIKNIKKNNKWNKVDTNKKEWVLAKDLSNDDLICIKKNKINFENRNDYIKYYNVWENFKDHKCSRIIDGKVKSFRTDKEAGVPEKLILDKTFYEILGLYIAEGWIDKTIIGFGFHIKEIYLIDKINSYFKKYSFNPTINIDKEHNSASIRINSFIFSKIFSDFGGIGCNNKRFPSTNIITKNEIIDIIKYYLIGDGHNRKNKKGYTVASTSQQLIWQLSNILNSFGCFSIPNFRDGKIASKRHKKAKDEWKNQFVINFSSMSYNKLYELGIIPIKPLLSSSTKPKYLEDKDYFYTRIAIDIEKYNGKLFNIQVENDSSYQANFVCVHNSHYLNKSDAFAHEILKAIDAKATLDTPLAKPGSGERGRLVFSGFDYHVKSAEEMLEKFTANEVDMSNTIAEMCNVNIPLKQNHIPKFDVNIDDRASIELLKKKAREGWAQLGINKQKNVKEYLERVKIELADIEEANLQNYFLIVWDIVRFCLDNKIPVGRGRGSAAGSLVSYLLRITDVDPIENGLIWERFWNRGRKDSMPDIDLDICIERRNEVVDYLRKKFGEDKVFPMCSISTMTTKVAIKDVGKVVGLPFFYVNQLTDKIPHKCRNIKQAIDENKEIKLAALDGIDKEVLIWEQDLTQLNKDPQNNKEQIDLLNNQITDRKKKLKTTFDVAQKLEDVARQRSAHACALLISDEPVNGRVPLCFDARNKKMLTAFDMYDLEDLGYLKLDILGLKTLDVCNKVCPDSVRGLRTFNDPKVFDLISSGYTKGIFQFESPLGRQWCKRIKPRNILELSDLNALLRPAVLEMGLSDEYVKNRIDPATIEYIHDDLKPILKDTYGVMVYQESMLQIVNKFAGFDLAKSDLLRKACIAEGSLIMTNCGPKYIEDLVSKNNKYKILSIKDNKTIYSKIKNVWKVGTKQVFKIKSKNGYSIELTEDHKIFTQDGWKPVKNITINDFIIIPQKYIYKGRGLQRGGLNINRSILLSYFIGEGCWTEKCKPKITNSDPWIVNKIINIIISEFGNNCFTIKTFKNGCKDIILKNNCKDWIKSIYKPVKSRQKFLPEIVYNSENEKIRAFIGSYFSAEGDVSNGHVTISSTSKDICRKIQMLLIKENIPSSFQVKNTKYKGQPYISYRVVICDKRYISMFMNTYYNYICPNKIEQIKNILNKDYRKSFESFIVPSCFILPISQSNNLCGIFGIVDGTYYNKNITYEKARRINQIMKDKMLQKIIDADYKFCQIEEIILVGEKNVYDFEAEDTHCGFINGILVHNCGKKLPEEMEKYEKDFINGCLNNGYKEEIARKLWSWINATADYSFNKSHSLSYAQLAYITAWMKLYHTEKFFWSLLLYSKNEQKPQEEIRELFFDAKKFRINIKSPSATRGNSDFELDKKDIYFGLMHIKGIGNSSFRAITNIKNLSWDQILRSRNSLKIKKDVLEALILSGAMDYLGLSRRTMFVQYQFINELTDKELPVFEHILYGDPVQLTKTTQKLGTQILIIPRVNNFKEAIEKLLSFINNENKDWKLIISSRADKLSEMCQSLLNDYNNGAEFSIKEKASYETNYLGIPATCSSVDGYYNYRTTHFLIEVENEQDNVGICTVAMISKFKETIDKLDRKMAFLTLEDRSFSMDAILFANQYMKYNKLLEPGKVVLIEGKKKKGSFIIDNIEAL